MPMHVAIICERLVPRDHAGRQALLLANALAKRGHRVSLLCDRSVRMDIEEGVEVACHHGGKLSRFALGIIRFRYWIARWLAERQPDYTIALTTLIPADVVIPCDGTAAGWIRALRNQRAPLPVRLSAWLHTLLPAMQLRRLWEKRSLLDPGVRSIVADNELILAELKQILPEQDQRIQRIDPAVQDPALPDARTLRERIARGLGLDTSSAWLVFPYRSAWLDGFEPLMLALQSLLDRGDDVVLLLAGPFKYTHLAWVAQLGLRDHVRFLGPPDEPAELIAAADLVVMPTTHDPGAAWALATLAQGRPLITTPACAGGQCIDEQAGVVLPGPPDPASLASAIKQAIAGREGGLSAAPPPKWTADARAEAIQALLQGETPSGGA